MLTDVNRRMISRCQAQYIDIARIRRDSEDQATEASNAIMNWEIENQGLKNIIARLEDDLVDRRLDLASRANSPERGLRLER
eukprot:16443956-Heterocapsa_arctica.AAC.1